MTKTIRYFLYAFALSLFINPGISEAKKKKKRACKKGFVAKTQCKKQKVCVPNLKRVKKLLKNIKCSALGNTNVYITRSFCTATLGNLGAKFCGKIAKNGKVNLKSTCRQLKALKGCSVKTVGCIKKKGSKICKKVRPFCVDLNKCIWTRTKRICKTKCVKKKAKKKKKKNVVKKNTCKKPRLKCIQPQKGSCLVLNDKACRRGYTYKEETWKGGKGYTGCQTWATHCEKKHARIDCDDKGCRARCTKPQKFCSHFRGIEYSRRKKDCCSKVGLACRKWGVQCIK
jgi:hypothetical protein